MDIKMFPQLIKFGIGGVLGFLIDALLLYALKLSLGLYGARLISFISAVFATWLFNRNITFNDKRYPHWYQEFAYYFLCMAVGGVVNLTFYMLLVSKSKYAAQCPIIGVAVGSIAGMTINFFTSKFLIFRRR